MILERFCYSPLGTFGRLIVGDLELYTCERPWKNNEPRVSCVPEGRYALESHSSEKYPDTWALVGDTVSHYAEPGKARSLVVFHRGNTMHDTLGCILPGLFLGSTRYKVYTTHENGRKTWKWSESPTWAVQSSRSAITRLRAEMNSTPMQIQQARRLLITRFIP